MKFLTQTGYVYRNLAKGDEDAVRELLERSSLKTEWEWMYHRNPNFDPSLVAIAEENGKIVGCNHWLRRDVKLSDSLVARAALCCDIAVDPDYRKRGIGKSLLLFLRSASLLKAGGPVLTYMFSRPELSKRLYQPAVGYVPIATSTVTYGIRWSWKQFIRTIETGTVNMSGKGELGTKGVQRNFRIVFHVLGAPPLTIALNQGRIEASEGDVEGSAVRIKSDLCTLARVRRKETRMTRMRELFKALLTGRLRVRGSLLDVIRLYHNLTLLEEILGLLQ